jgi:hypothetical protein
MVSHSGKPGHQRGWERQGRIKPVGDRVQVVVDMCCALERPAGVGPATGGLEVPFERLADVARCDAIPPHLLILLTVVLSASQHFSYSCTLLCRRRHQESLTRHGPNDDPVPRSRKVITADGRWACPRLFAPVGQGPVRLSLRVRSCGSGPIPRRSDWLGPWSSVRLGKRPGSAA